jgi:hypothetical protein
VGRFSTVSVLVAPSPPRAPRVYSSRSTVKNTSKACPVPRVPSNTIAQWNSGFIPNDHNSTGQDEILPSYFTGFQLAGLPTVQTYSAGTFSMPLMFEYRLPVAQEPLGALLLVGFPTTQVATLGLVVNRE